MPHKLNPLILFFILAACSPLDYSPSNPALPVTQIPFYASETPAPFIIPITDTPIILPPVTDTPINPTPVTDTPAFIELLPVTETPIVIA
ncbi:MAG TPA: hypothetical protein VFI68_14045, partial [Anaerolineales bacterium]|nr:hypothetical protein [Anaerolineales bacterium]